MRLVALILVLLLASGLFGIGFSVCRDFITMDESEMAEASQDMDDCERTCRLAQDESPAVLKKIQTHVPVNAAAVLVPHLTQPPTPHLWLLHGASRLDASGCIPIGEVYLRSASLLI